MQSGLVKIMASETKITLRYNGPSVDDGSMPVEDVVSALQGFAGAFTKVANLGSESHQQQLRVQAIKTGSFELTIVAWLVLGQAPGPLGNIELAVDATRWVIEKLFGVFEAKKHVKNRPYDVSVKGNNNQVTLINAEKVEMVIPLEVLELLRQKTVDGDLSKVVSPLDKDRVNSTEIIAESETGVIAEKVSSDEKQFFQPIDTITTKESEISGRFVSLNKDTKRGSFGLPSGKNVPYTYVGPNPDSFPNQFARNDPVKVIGTVTFDENLQPMQIAIKSVTYIQRELPLGGPTN